MRGDIAAREFETWACEAPELEAELGSALFMDVVSADYRDPVATLAVSARLEAYLRSREDHLCECLTIADVGVVDMGGHGELVFAQLDEVARRGAPYWWLSAARCRQCGQSWLVGSEERQNDVFCMRRLSAAAMNDVVNEQKWPADFDHYESLVEIGHAAGRSVRFVDPLTSIFLHATITDIARDRPGVPLSTLIRLLNLDTEIAEQLALRVMAEAGVVIDLGK